LSNYERDHVVNIALSGTLVKMARNFVCCWVAARKLIK